MTVERKQFPSGSKFESVVGFSRAVRVGEWLLVSGTTASGPEGPVGGDDAGKQAAEVLSRITAAVNEAGGDTSDIVRTRVYLTSMSDFDSVAREHSAVFGDIRPATTFVGVSELANPALLVEIEADALVSAD
ncbi:Enamine deaminase RidA, house cleaning of reactive enamine intermediates, YjgF/YER057c/UK114 family [Actinopolyspora lacussalsi subsp. righensis]|uniref:Enamine deaminase RidA, house cleaning of reactive enamine intermediates, YjgF/YER057c/UK114 family n=1 Tax=Actinopolyspora righensis TaxID=995060 RepID=A0A1I7CFV6_9ACTN|nr:RidA family protein [Actinopolyspora righensis]SFT98283.1 Enamine deaminase RidA, house cleaning of reactive enamine intermediates, YjgF/YER057c/UK114 family [Actinopolyspora righensis]